MTTLLIDLSHHNKEPNWVTLRGGGVVGVILKASEGTSFADPVFTAWRGAAHAAGLAVGMYGFADLGSAAAEAAWFAKVIGSLQPGEFVGLDEEVTKAEVDPAVWAAQWIDALATLGIRVRLLYINKSFLAAHDWTPIVQRGVLLWLADYDGSPTAAAPSGPWKQVELKQYTSAGSVPGETGDVDIDALWGALTDLTGDDDMSYSQWPKADRDFFIQDMRDSVLGVFFGATDAGTTIVDQLTGPQDPDNHTLNSDLRNTLADLETKLALITQAVQGVAAQASALSQQVAGASGLTCQGSPRAVLSAIGQAASTAASGA